MSGSSVAAGLHGSAAPWRVRLAAWCFVIAGLNGCGAPPAPPLTPADFTLGGVPADSDSTEIRRTFGEPDSIASSENPFDSRTPLITWIYDGFEVRFGESGVPVGYLILEPGERTARGVGVGDTGETVLQLYGDPDIRAKAGWTFVDAADESGSGLHIIDLIVRADTVRRIYIGWALD